MESENPYAIEYSQQELLAALKPAPAVPDAPKDIEDMNKAELHAVLDGLGVPYAANTNKADLIALIQTAKA